MKKSAPHIISNLNWETSFDKKEAGPELQQRLSAWSRYRLTKVIEEILDTMCLPGQTWKIPSLKLDLGTVDYHDMETQLALNLKAALSEELKYLLLYSSYGEHLQIRVENQETSELELLSGFLLHGHMPWSHDDEAGSANALMASLLETSFDEVIALVRHAGATHENVRKRLAWQISEVSIFKIIRGLEPAHHQQITVFSDEFSGLQQKKSIVKSVGRDFRKNVWLWVFNYLLSEKGTMFNKVAFMKSSIHQMAAHYNLSYTELLGLIGDALEAVKKIALIQPEFISTLKLITDENNGHESKALKAHESDTWQALEHYFKNKTLRSGRSNSDHFNGLIVNLHEENEERFNRLMASLSSAQSDWLQVAGQLGDKAYETLLHALDPASAGILIKVVKSIEHLGKANPGLFTKQDLREVAMSCLQQRKSSSAFISYCMDQLMKRSKETTAKIVLPEPPAALKTIDHLTFFEELKSYTESGSAVGTVQEQRGLDDILQSYMQERNDDYIFEAREIIRLQPEKSIETILKARDKATVAELLQSALDGDTTLLLLGNLGTDWHENIKLLKQLSEIIKTEKRSIWPTGSREEALLKTAALIAIEHPSLKPSAFLRLLLKTSGRYLTLDQQQVLQIAAGQTLADKTSVIPDQELLFDIWNRHLLKNRQFSLPLVLRLTARKKHNKASIAELLSFHFSDPDFYRFRQQTGSVQRQLLDHFVKGAGDQTALLVQNVMKRMTDTNDLNNAEYKLSELYWRSVLSYREHAGNLAKLESLFMSTVHFQFRLSQDVRRDRLSRTDSQNASPNMRRQEDLKQLLAQIEESIRDAETSLSVEIVPLSTPMQDVLQSEPASLRKIMAGIAPTAKRISVLKGAVEFGDFMQWICYDASGSVKEGAEALSGLWRIISVIASPSIASQLLDELWKQAWQLLKNKNWSQQKTIQLTTDLFTKLIPENDLKAEDILDEMAKHRIRLNASLGKALAPWLPELNTVRGAALIQTTPPSLEKAEARGLLHDLIHALFNKQQAPLWFRLEKQMGEKEVVNELLLHYHLQFYQYIKTHPLHDPKVAWLHELTGGKSIFEAISAHNSSHKNLLEILSAFYSSLGNITIIGISRKELQRILFGLVLKTWKNNSWKTVSAGNIWNELTWELTMKKGLAAKDVLAAFHHHRQLLPPALQAAWNKMNLRESSAASVNISAPLKKAKPVRRINTEEKAAADGIPVRNAGLVILNSFIPTLFERLGLLTPARTFVSEEAQADAVHYLQYIVTGHSSTEEAYLPMNKLLCGMKLGEPVREGIEISAEHERTISGLISAAISYWPKAGDSSINGFRGNWLVRNGILSYKKDRWELHVEKKAYDLLIHQSPFSFSIIKLPWMKEPLHVNWPY